MELTWTALEEIAKEKGVPVIEEFDKIIANEIMRIAPATSISKEFWFTHEGKKLLVEADYCVDINPNHDHVEIIGEIQTETEDVVELKEKVIRGYMKDKYFGEIEAIRDDLRAERTSVLRDF